MTAPQDMPPEDRDIRKINLLESVRMLCIALIVVGLGLGGLVWSNHVQLGHHEDNGKDRTAALTVKIDTLNSELDDQKQATRDITAAFDAFKLDNQAYLDNHARTQRLICGWYRANHVPLPDNGDCDGR